MTSTAPSRLTRWRAVWRFISAWLMHYKRRKKRNRVKVPANSLQPDQDAPDDMSPAETREAPEEPPAPARFSELRQDIWRLLDKSKYDSDIVNLRSMWEELDITCCRMAAVCRRLLGGN